MEGYAKITVDVPGNPPGVFYVSQDYLYPRHIVERAREAGNETFTIDHAVAILDSKGGGQAQGVVVEIPEGMTPFMVPPTPEPVAETPEETPSQDE